MLDGLGMKTVDHLAYCDKCMTKDGDKLIEIIMHIPKVLALLCELKHHYFAEVECSCLLCPSVLSFVVLQSIDFAWWRFLITSVRVLWQRLDWMNAWLSLKIRNRLLGAGPIEFCRLRWLFSCCAWRARACRFVSCFPFLSRNGRSHLGISSDVAVWDKKIHKIK